MVVLAYLAISLKREGLSNRGAMLPLAVLLLTWAATVAIDIQYNTLTPTYALARLSPGVFWLLTLMVRAARRLPLEVFTLVSALNLGAIAAILPLSDTFTQPCNNFKCGPLGVCR